MRHRQLSTIYTTPCLRRCPILNPTCILSCRHILDTLTHKPRHRCIRLSQVPRIRAMHVTHLSHRSRNHNQCPLNLIRQPVNRTIFSSGLTRMDTVYAPTSADILRRLSLATNQRGPDGTQFDWTQAAARVEGALRVWTDGSVQTAEDGVRTDGYAAVIIDPESPEEAPRALAVAAGKYNGPHCHSDMLEALAIGHAIHCIPRDKEAVILTDSMTSVNWWQHYIVNPTPGGAAKRRQAAAHKVWELVAVRVRERTQPVTIEWVKAHVGIPGNELADKLAKAAEEATSSALPVWNMNTSAAPVTQTNLLAEQEKDLQQEEESIAFGWKAVLGLLPTLQRQYRWHPNMECQRPGSTYADAQRTVNRAAKASTKRQLAQSTIRSQ
ncbi:RNase H-domain-containing protein [Thamnocephalis sphaerospora]|uniref:RNase H-domain-containing protein n=1 Tax=Thamnocephalis sphaerospora TaxID=78915 RepID=A0A4P9XG18_9FUNG|nr:RNase H-domain-containing protein [Thamnocephalis sphaerospora]|eukprot:RKP04544.1 RNase H-domain-containing protein [Thamnocephalis sphaerospora]